MQGKLVIIMKCEVTGDREKLANGGNAEEVANYVKLDGTMARLL